MARLLVQLSVQQLAMCVMILSSVSSILLSSSDAAGCDALTEGADPTRKMNPAHTPRIRWLTPRVNAESSAAGKMPDINVPDVHSSSAAQIAARNRVKSQSAHMHEAQGSASEERELINRFEGKESRMGTLRDSVGISRVAGNLDQLQRGRPMKAQQEDEYIRLLQKVDLLSCANVPALGNSMWQITDEEETSHRTTALILAIVMAAETNRDAEILADIDSFLYPKEVNLPKRKAVAAPGVWQSNDAQYRKRALLADISPPGIWITDSEANDTRFQKRRLLADISPPGMWSDDSDDLENKYQKRRLLADISPDMWQGSDGQVTDMTQK